MLYNGLGDDSVRVYAAPYLQIANGESRGDQIYPPGVLKLRDIVNCFPFEDPVVVMKVTGQAIWDALENGVSNYPALEGKNMISQQ